MNNITAESVKAIFLDMDGTILDETGSVSFMVQQCLKKITNQGIPIYLASGRSYESMLPIHRSLGLNTPLIAYNGAQLIEHLGDNIIKQNLLNPLLVEDAIRVAGKNNIYVQFYLDKKAYYVGAEKIAVEYALKSGIKPKVLNRSLNYKEKCTNGMFLVSETNCNNRSLVKLSEELGLSTLWKEKGSIFFSSEGTLEFSNKGISKGNMISYILENNGISHGDIIAIGDGFNDREMIQNAGLGIAMGNAPVGLKSIADITIPKNTEHGVSQFFNLFFNFI